MDCCYITDGCEEFAVTPVLVTPCYPQKCAEEPPMCFPCLPACGKGKVMYCCEKRAPKAPPRTPMDRDGYSEPNLDRQYGSRNMPPRDQTPSQRDNSCCHGNCKAVRTKYVMPCYRYEDGRIERYVPTRHGRLPMSAYRRNGMQDQIHGYRGAIRYLCAADTVPDRGCCVHTIVEPMKKIYPRVTMEMQPVRKKKDKK